MTNVETMDKLIEDSGLLIGDTVRVLKVAPHHTGIAEYVGKIVKFEKLIEMVNVVLELENNPFSYSPVCFSIHDVEKLTVLVNTFHGTKIYSTLCGAKNFSDLQMEAAFSDSDGDKSAVSIQVGDTWQDAMGNTVVIVSLDSDGLNKDYPIVGIMQSGVNEGRARIYASNGVDTLHAPRSLVKLVTRGN